MMTVGAIPREQPKLLCNFYYACSKKKPTSAQAVLDLMSGSGLSMPPVK